MESSTITGPLDTSGEDVDHEVEALEAQRNVEDGYHDELAAAREAEGLDRESALPVAADDAGGAVDLSDGVELQLPGLEGGVKLSFSGIGGKKPEESRLTVTGGSFSVPGQFEKGDDVYAELKLRITEVAFADTLDSKTAQATTSKRKHKGRVIGAVVIERGAVEKLNELTAAVQGLLDGSVSEQTVRELVGGAPTE